MNKCEVVLLPASCESSAGLGDPAEGLRFVARQPILDRRGTVFGYELLFRNGRELAFCGDGDEATRTMLDNSVLFGSAGLTGGALAFINCTLEALSDRLVEILPTSSTVLEVLETLPPTAQLVAACRSLKSVGFKIALDDFEWKEGIEPLIELADFIKVDFLQSDRSARRAILNRLSGNQVTLLAEKLETREDYERACAEGFTLFQGYYFCHPALLKKHLIPSNKLSQIELLRYLNETPIDLHKVRELVEREPAITYRLLRLVNSPACAMRQEVRSVEAALIAVGEKTFRKMATLAIAATLNSGQPAEIVRMALVRARFCELAAGLTWFDTTEQYLLGLFSLLPAMLRVPMQEAISALPLRQEIRNALLGKPSRERCLLSWIEASERGDASQCDAIVQEAALDKNQLIHCAVEAIRWADQVLQIAR
jgi:c-di-GMP-related signal transduction protein